MDLKGDQIALFLSGQDIPVIECNIVIHQPTIKEIVLFKETSFISVIQLFINVEENAEKIRENNPASQDYSDFQLLMVLLNQQGDLQKDICSFFQLVFPKYKVEIRESDISFYIDEHRVGMINSFNYTAFCKIIEYVFGLPSNKNKYNPANDKAAEIAKKFKKREEELAKRKNQLSDNAPSLFASYVSILAVGLQLDMNTIWNYTPFQLYDIFDRYFKKVNSDFYQRVSTMPMMDTSKMEEPEPWTNNLYNK